MTKLPKERCNRFLYKQHETNKFPDLVIFYTVSETFGPAYMTCNLSSMAYILFSTFLKLCWQPGRFGKNISIHATRRRFLSTWMIDFETSFWIVRNLIKVVFPNLDFITRIVSIRYLILDLKLYLGPKQPFLYFEKIYFCTKIFKGKSKKPVSHWPYFGFLNYKFWCNYFHIDSPGCKANTTYLTLDGKNLNLTNND